MIEKISKNNVMHARLQEIRMSDYKRFEAEAQLARAEAVVEMLSDIAGGLGRVLRKLVLRPYRKLTASLG